MAQYPIEPRDSARLMIVDRSSGSITEALVRDLPQLLSPGDALIFNNTKVLFASLQGSLVNGSTVDCLLTHAISPSTWFLLAKPARKLQPGVKICFPDGVEGLVERVEDDGRRVVTFSTPLTADLLSHIGCIPLPPYIRRLKRREDSERYQTIYAASHGSVAAPTAGLHFTQELFSSLSSHKISQHYVTLHVGTGTFLPIRSDDIRQHTMHTEAFELTQQAADSINAVSSSNRKVAVGTTSCRVLETIADETGKLQAQSGSTNLFIYPGYRFRCISSLFTNFHTPGSSLLVLVSTFMGYELMQEAYAKAIERKFRFFSYGDAMLIL